MTVSAPQRRPALPGWLCVAIAIAVPLLIYFLGAPGVAGRGTWFVVGEVMGIVAAVLLALTAILAARVRPLERLFGDMTNVYVAHGICGLTMFALVTAHPMLYVFGTLPAARDAAGIVVPFRLVALDWCSWLTIALALLPTLFVRLRFDLWRWTHLFLGAAVILTAVSLTITSRTFDTFQVPALRIYLFALFGLAIVAVVYVGFVRRIAEPKLEYEVVEAEPHPDAHAIELRLRPVGRPLRFEAGQFSYVDLLDERLQVRRDYEAHPYSIASAPHEDELTVVVGSAGPHTERIQRIAAEDGARALVHGAYGRLAHWHPSARTQLWLAGGTGVTPFLSMAAHLAERGGDHDVTLVVAVDQEAHAFYLPRLRRWEAGCEGLRVIVWATEERGRLTADALAEEVPDLAERLVLMSGPEAMVSQLTHQLHGAGVPHHRIRCEVAIGPPQRWRYASPALRVMRWAVGAELAAFVAAIAVSVVGRALS